jgi:hypothetical protein
MLSLSQEVTVPMPGKLSREVAKMRHFTWERSSPAMLKLVKLFLMLRP